MFIISYASCSPHLTVGAQRIANTLDEAIEVAIKMAQANGAMESEEDVREELTKDGDYLDESQDWGIFIGQPDE
jgi:hypothetical protein